MKIRIYSDLHLEFYKPNEKFEISEMPDDKDTVLILAGDIVLGKSIATHEYFFRACSERFRDVIYIMGNHEYYGTNFGVINKIRDFLKYEFLNIHVFDRQSIVIDDVAFVCATMWSDFDNGNPLSKMYAHQEMNDYKKIRYGPKTEPWKMKFTPNFAHSEFIASKEYIFRELGIQSDAGNKTVVVTHMAPSYQSINPCYKTNRLTGSYASNLEGEILVFRPDLWVHGHIHYFSDYKIDSTRVVCNPFGYKHHEENNTFNSKLLVEV